VFVSVEHAGRILRSLFDLPPISTAVFAFVLYVVLGVALAFSWKHSSNVFVGCAVFLALLYLMFVLCTAPQMHSEKWLNAYDRGDEESFGTQFLASLQTTILFAHGFGTVFHLCDKIAEVR
jgi:succinate dehydrogenase/fumarate reductase cytochrome b subunit